MWANLSFSQSPFASKISQVRSSMVFHLHCCAIGTFFYSFVMCSLMITAGRCCGGLGVSLVTRLSWPYRDLKANSVQRPPPEFRMSAWAQLLRCYGYGTPWEMSFSLFSVKPVNVHWEVICITMRSYRTRQLLHLSHNKWSSCHTDAQVLLLGVHTKSSECSSQWHRATWKACPYLLPYHNLIVDHGSDPLVLTTSVAVLYLEWRLSAAKF